MRNSNLLIYDSLDNASKNMSIVNTPQTIVKPISLKLNESNPVIPIKPQNNRPSILIVVGILLQTRQIICV